ncbi:hypothetical protein AB0D49_29080 [Streptomyces sp. NPDC048290]|uniref:hypothetical protein n=1 Tax=Streptomyces sp. NPDC048290 TaxID=3155811 RepID=UPI00341A3B9E
MALADNDAAVVWPLGHLAACDVVLVNASRGARLDEVAAAFAYFGGRARFLPTT